MPNVCYFEIPADDVSRAQAFYNELFQWSFSKMDCSSNPEKDCQYHIIQADEQDRGLSFGGLMKRQCAEHQITQYVGVENVDDYIAKVEKLGGTIVVPKTAVPGKGYFAIFLDTEKNGLGLWQCDQNAA